MNFKNSKCLIVIVLAFFLPLLVSCERNNENNNVYIHKWDNRRYSDWETSVGIDAYNSNSYKKINDKLNKANSLLYITDPDEPITIKFNNNGKERDFVLTIFYDYVQIPFKITADGIYDNIYTFALDDSYEIELPLFLPKEIDRTGSHKLLISFSIGHNIHAADLEELSDWYGMGSVYDISFDGEADFSNKKIVYNKPSHIDDRTFNMLLVPDAGADIINININSLPKMIEVKKGKPFHLTYRLSTDNSEKVLFLVTIGFQQTPVDGVEYKLFTFDKNKTAYGDIQLIAPDEVGLYEVIALKILNPFEKIQVGTWCDVKTSVRFTLKVID